MKKLNESKKKNIGSNEIYAMFANFTELKELYCLNMKAFERKSQKWDVEYRRRMKYWVHCFELRSLGDGMTVGLGCGGEWKKPRFLLDDVNKTGIEFMNSDSILQTIDVKEDIDWKSLNGQSKNTINKVKSLDGYYPVQISQFSYGRAKVTWTLSPSGMFYMDEDGFGMEPDNEEVKLIGFIDRNGNVIRKFACYG